MFLGALMWAFNPPASAIFFWSPNCWAPFKMPALKRPAKVSQIQRLLHPNSFFFLHPSIPFLRPHIHIGPQNEASSRSKYQFATSKRTFSISEILVFHRLFSFFFVLLFGKSFHRPLFPLDYSATRMHSSSQDRHWYDCPSQVWYG